MGRPADSPTLDLTIRNETIMVLAIVSLMCAVGLAHGAEVQFTVLGSTTARPMPCCIYMRDAAGKPVQPRNLPFWKNHFACPGVAELDLADGDYIYELDCGPEWLVTTGRVTVVNNDVIKLTNRMTRLTDLTKEGWWSGELHIHRPLEDIKLLMEANDLHIAPVITWWNNKNLWTNQPLPADPLVRFDNNRYYHVMAGEDERGGGALLYLNLNQPLPLHGAEREYPSSMRFLEEAKQHKEAWVDVEKPFWYDVPVWLASGLVDSIGIVHNHMQRNGLHPGEAWGRRRDVARFPPPYGNAFWTQEIYYHVLNCGLRIPPSAGSASGALPNPVGFNRMYVHVEGDLTYEKWWDGLKAGRVFVSNGPLLRCRADGELPGFIFKSQSGTPIHLNVEVALDSRDPISSVEIIQNGRMTRAVSGLKLRQTASLGEVTFTESGWFLVRAMTEHTNHITFAVDSQSPARGYEDGVANTTNTFRFASTGPFYVEMGDSPRRISKSSVNFFLDWVHERMERLHLSSPGQNEEVLAYLRQAETFWRNRLAQANTE
jgi:hypothetical protein